MAMPPMPSVTYFPGRWSALAANDVWLLADLDPSSPILAACWETVERGGGVDGLLGVILREGLRSVPSFALVGAGPDGYRLLVSGKAQAEATSPDRPEPTLVSAAEAPTWIEKRLAGHPDIRLSADDAGAAEAAIALPLSGGVVLASVVLVGGMDSFARDAAPAVSARVGAPAHGSAPVAVTPGNATAEFDPTGITADAERGVAALEAPESSLTDPIEEFDEPAEGDHQVVAEDDADAPPDAPPAAPAGVPAEPSPPAVFGLGDPGAEPDAPRPRAQPPQSPSPQPPPPAGPYVAGPPSDPFAPPVASTAPHCGSEPPDYTPRAQHAPLQVAGPTVHAVSCPHQHLNPPYATICRVCGLAIGQQEPFPTQRPTLGILNMSTGDMVPLDRDVVLGRAPFHADTSAQSRPHLVQLASPGNDISRSHVRFSIEGWHIQVTDLGSTNGTVVTIPGQAPVRLRAHDPFTIVAGSTITIADEVNVRFEVPS